MPWHKLITSFTHIHHLRLSPYMGKARPLTFRGALIRISNANVRFRHSWIKFRDIFIYRPMYMSQVLKKILTVSCGTQPLEKRMWHREREKRSWREGIVCFHSSGSFLFAKFSLKCFLFTSNFFACGFFWHSADTSDDDNVVARHSTQLSYL